MARVGLQRHRGKKKKEKKIKEKMRVASQPASSCPSQFI
jgi:hypothetical protein